MPRAAKVRKKGSRAAYIWESSGLIDRLRTVVHRFDQYREVLSKAQRNIDSARAYMEKVQAVGTQLASVE
jgi:hypothetical protein